MRDPNQKSSLPYHGLFATKTTGELNILALDGHLLEWRGIHLALNSGRKSRPSLRMMSGPRIFAELLQGVLKYPKTHDIVHCACHGVSDPPDPSKGCPLLLDDNGNTRLSKSSVSNASAVKIQAQLAFLSACCTAENAAAYLVDEVLHLSSGFQLAGFSHVIRTMWGANDCVCATIASFAMPYLQWAEIRCGKHHRSYRGSSR
jgi:hypothetical protein